MAKALILCSAGNGKSRLDGAVLLCLQQGFELRVSDAGNEIVASAVVPKASPRDGDSELVVLTPHHQALGAISQQHPGMRPVEGKVPDKLAGSLGKQCEGCHEGQQQKQAAGWHRLVALDGDDSGDRIRG